MKVDHNAGFYGQKPLFGAFVRKQGNLSKSAENGEENGFYKEGRIGKMLNAYAKSGYGAIDYKREHA